MKKIYNYNYLFYILCFLFGALATFSITPYSLLPLIFMLGYGVFLISNLSCLKKTFLAGWFLGLGWFSFGLYWIGSAFFFSDALHQYLMPLSIIILPSFLALFWALAFFLARLLTPLNFSPLLLIIINLSLLEFCRAHIFTGFPWLMPSIILSSNIYLIQIFSFVGSFTGNLMVLLFSILPMILFSKFYKNKAPVFFIFVPILILLYSSFYRYNNRNLIETNTNFSIILVQPNINQKDKWDKNKRKYHLAKLVNLSKKKLEKSKKYKIIIWPETSFAGAIPNEKNLLSKFTKTIIKDQNTYLVLGLLSLKEKKVFNSLIFLNSSGNIEYKYDKLHLVPFGEYVPFRKYFNRIANLFSPTEFSPGILRKNIALKGLGEILTLICYEILFSNEVTKRTSKNTKLIINITNDAWFGRTVGPYQHFALSKIRSVELGIPLARVANTGISSVISPYGKEIVTIPLYEEGVIMIDSIPPLKQTMYKKFGEYIFIISILFIMFINYSVFWNNKKENINEK